MLFFAAVKLRKSQERLVALRPYAGKMMEVVRRVVSRIKGDSEIQPGPAAQAFLSPREEKRIRVVLVASDKGLCGGFNANVLKASEDKTFPGAIADLLEGDVEDPAEEPSGEARALGSGDLLGHGDIQAPSRPGSVSARPVPV